MKVNPPDGRKIAWGVGKEKCRGEVEEREGAGAGMKASATWKKEEKTRRKAPV